MTLIIIIDYFNLSDPQNVNQRHLWQWTLITATSLFVCLFVSIQPRPNNTPMIRIVMTLLQIVAVTCHKGYSVLTSANFYADVIWGMLGASLFMDLNTLAWSSSFFILFYFFSEHDLKCMPTQTAPLFSISFKIVETMTIVVWS